MLNKKNSPELFLPDHCIFYKMFQYGKELFDWLNNGASIYICGKKEPMSVDVEDSIMQIVQKCGNKNIEEAVQFVEGLKEEDRYLKDVY